MNHRMMNLIKRRASALLGTLFVAAVLITALLFAVAGVVERASLGRKISQARADMRTYAVALESYFVDRGAYPPTTLYSLATGAQVLFPLEEGLIRLSTPVAYMQDSLLPEPFNSRMGNWTLFRGGDVIAAGGPSGAGHPIYFYFSYPVNPQEQQLAASTLAFLASGASGSVTFQDAMAIVGKKWMIVSPGADGFYVFDQFAVGSGGNLMSAFVMQQVVTILPRYGGVYDPTNGVDSQGDLVRFQGPLNATPTQTPLPTRTPSPEKNAVEEWTAYE